MMMHIDTQFWRGRLRRGRPRSGGIQSKSTKSTKAKRGNAAGEKIAARWICRNFRDLAAGTSTIKAMPRQLPRSALQSSESRHFLPPICVGYALPGATLAAVSRSARGWREEQRAPGFSRRGATIVTKR
jgi:hypothetical protein